MEAATNFCGIEGAGRQRRLQFGVPGGDLVEFLQQRHGEPQPFNASAKSIQRDFTLRAAVEVLELGHALGELVVADDDGGAGIELVGPLHAPFHVAAIVLFDGDAVAAQGAGDAERLGLGCQPERRDHDGPWQGRRLVAQHHQAFDAARPADAGRRRPAQLGDQPVIAATAQHRALGADMAGHELEGGMGVVVEAAHQAGIDLERDAGR